MEVNNDEVICPNCVTQFRAIPVNVQDLMRSQAAEIERLTEWQQGAKDVAITSEWHRYKREEAETARDQLKAKNQKLVEALKSVVNVGGLAAASVAEQALKENT